MMIIKTERKRERERTESKRGDTAAHISEPGSTHIYIYIYTVVSTSPNSFSSSWQLTFAVEKKKRGENHKKRTSALFFLSLLSLFIFFFLSLSFFFFNTALQSLIYVHTQSVLRLI